MTSFLPGVPEHLVKAAYEGAPGNEMASGKFFSPESSSALVANSFGYFLDKVTGLPRLPMLPEIAWPPIRIELEGIVRFPWSGGRHPCLDVLIETLDSLVGVESKRYEPFRSKGETALSEAYWRPVWGDRMAGYQGVRDALKDRQLAFRHLDAGQLLKHAFGLRSEVQRPRCQGKQAILLHLHAEPPAWPDGRPIDPAVHAAHREEVARFAELVREDEVVFRTCAYSDLLDGWSTSADDDTSRHAQAVQEHFNVSGSRS